MKKSKKSSLPPIPSLSATEIQDIEDNFITLIESADLQTEYGRALHKLGGMNLSPAEKSMWLDSSAKGDASVDLIYQYIQTLLTLINRHLANRETDSDSALFFVYLNQVLEEIPSHFSAVSATIANIRAANAKLAEDVGATEEDLGLVDNIRTTAQAAAAQLTQDERLTIDYLRNRFCHINPGKYFTGDSPKTTHYRSILRPALRKRIQAQLDLHQGNLYELARTLAKKVEPYIHRLDWLIGYWAKNATIT